MTTLNHLAQETVLSTLYDAPTEPAPQPRAPETPNPSSEPAPHQMALPPEERSPIFDGQPEEAPPPPSMHAPTEQPKEQAQGLRLPGAAVENGI